MEETKPWYLSKTVIASVLVVIFGILGAFGLSSAALEGEKDSIVEVVLQLAGAIAGGVAIYGRLTAKARINGRGDGV